MYTITIEETGLDSPKLLIKLQGQDVAYYGDNFSEVLEAISEYLNPVDRASLHDEFRFSGTPVYVPKSVDFAQFINDVAAQSDNHEQARKTIKNALDYYYNKSLSD